ncbi:hypothetical protein J1G42_07150 [Cellulomonas sp. zg-ZUI222]|uniref:DUF4244 domain-containing protein n=1 Tax=Cellulomonas wangleii TaxID=2816956 RepID=A0ABX8D1L0_9CELL|nr:MULTISPECIES: hypothetical protein [Cellulomonas]MBO0899738.1 hypothetical protein [Cellulomonas sp. zg-ZUI22]MBO0920600.1 hypothetical protein [Cellulomonas wangleii]MBO0922982.1 hypothetical protein [Cellulomonas wangleii]QVI61372.1 hypothetical protein KG103_12890 [Cellulomonas wangleii]
MTRMFVKTQVRIQKALENAGGRDAGQGTIEYIGILVVAGLLLVAVIGTVKGWNPKGFVDSAITEIEGVVGG